MFLRVQLTLVHYQGIYVQGDIVILLTVSSTADSKMVEPLLKTPPRICILFDLLLFRATYFRGTPLLGKENVTSKYSLHKNSFCIHAH